MLGGLLLGVALFMLISAAVCLPYGEYSCAISLLLSAVIAGAIGGILLRLGRRAKTDFFARDAVAMVALAWFGVSLVGALPYLFSGTIADISSAVFESASGFTTTGSTVLTDIESCSKGIIFWRSLTQWLGGMGIIVLFIAVFPQVGTGARHLFKSEVPGPSSEGLRPKIKETSSLLWKIYLGITLAEFLALLACGLNPYDAACHSLAGMATGGFSTKNASIGHYNSAAVDLVVTLFMFLAGVNFALYYLLFRDRSRVFWKDTEFRVYVFVVAICTIIVTCALLPHKESLFEAARYGVFQVVALLTTTGFGTDDFNVYPPLARILLVVLMFLGGSAGSTAGGLKIVRIVIIVKAAYREIYRVFYPHAVLSVRMAKVTISEDVIRTALVFFALFVFAFTFGTLFMSFLGLELETAFSSVVATLANIGPGLDRVGSLENYAFIPAIGKLFLSFCMILGRLELFTVLVLLIPDFWKR
jgi:trk system potassium uptake protein TrkH